MGGGNKKGLKDEIYLENMSAEEAAVCPNHEQALDPLTISLYIYFLALLFLLLWILLVPKFNPCQFFFYFVTC